MANELNDKTEFTVPLKNLISLLAGTSIAVWGYFGVIERLSFLEHGADIQKIKVEHNYAWTKNFTPPKDVVDSVLRVRVLEKSVTKLEMRVKHLEDRVK